MVQYTKYSNSIYTVSNLLSKTRCEELIELSEKIGYEVAPMTTQRGFEMKPEVRNNSRVIYDSFDLAEEFWSLVEPWVIKNWKEWSAMGLNERFRFYRYDPEQKFDWHQDGAFQRSNGQRSQFTLIFYLNSEYEGGCTEFINIKIPVEAGSTLFFRHSKIHRGAAVKSGRKYVLRTDIMYSSGQVIST